MTVQQSRQELEQHLKEQFAFLKASCASYDNGFEAEAKRLAHTIRVLLHDTNMSKSLLELLGCKNTLRFSSVNARLDRTPLVYCGVGMGFSETGVFYRANLESPTFDLAFDEWWAAPMMVNTRADLNFTRKSAVMNLANKDGGAHVDPNLTKQYAALSRSNGFEWNVAVGGQPGTVDNGPMPAIVRQIAHEVTHTLETQLEHLL